MPEYDIAGSTSSDLTGVMQDITVDSQDTDAATGKETSWQNMKWSQYYGYYKSIPELKQAIDMRAIWTVGKGFTTPDTRTKVLLGEIYGFGMDTFNTILKNMIITRRIAGDAFAEIIRDPITNELVNIKPLDPGQIKIVVNEKGIITRYEQVSKTGKKTQKFKPEDIFHLTNKRVADEIHGTSDIEVIEEIIKASNESFEDMKQLMHRHVKPIMAFKLDTDNQSKIDAFVTKMDEVINKGENIYIPKDTVDFELVSVPSNATLNPLPWRAHLRDYFFQVVGIPQIILGSSGEFTESTAKIAYLAFQQSVEDEQQDIEDQVWNQLYLKIELTFPASLQNELLSDEAKDGASTPQAPQPQAPQPLAMQPSDTTVGIGSGT
tara:strand:- start:2580 stop:3713 length:1134 start_codon:yes stop_codon:yes gene_type:complete